MKYFNIIFCKLLIILIFLPSFNFSGQLRKGITNLNSIFENDLSVLGAKKVFMAPKMITVHKSKLGNLLASAYKEIFVFDSDIHSFFYWNRIDWSLIRIDTVVADDDLSLTLETYNIYI